MAEHPHAALIRDGIERFSKGDMTVTDLFADDVVWHVPGDNPLAGDYRGKQAVLGFFAKMAERGMIAFNVHDVLANDEHTVALLDATATRTDGRSIVQRAVQVFHVRDGKVTEFWAYSEDQSAIDAFWS